MWLGYLIFATACGLQTVLKHIWIARHSVAARRLKPTRTFNRAAYEATDKLLKFRSTTKHCAIAIVRKTMCQGEPQRNVLLPAACALACSEVSTHSVLVCESLLRRFIPDQLHTLVRHYSLRTRLRVVQISIKKPRKVFHRFVLCMLILLPAAHRVTKQLLTWCTCASTCTSHLRSEKTLYMRSKSPFVPWSTPAGSVVSSA